MNILDFIEKHKYGIFATLIIHVAIFVYFQIATYQEAVLYEPWDFISAMKEAPDDIELTADQIESPENFEQLMEQEEVTSFVKDENDSRERSREDNTNYTSYAEGGTPSEIEKNYEQQLKDEIRRQREDKDGGKSQERIVAEPTVNKKNDKPVKSGGGASEKGIAGATMVSFSLNNRHPLNHNDWYVRNPGYTCGNVNGIVKVAIVVDEGGRVIAANVIESESVNATGCMLQKSKEYALLSRFNYSSSAPTKQEGTITYRFVYKE